MVLWLGFAALAGVGTPVTVCAQAPLAADVQRYPLKGVKGRFDYLEIDAGRDRLLADHTGNGTLDVFTLADGAPVGSVPVGAAQGVAVDAARGRYYVTVSDRKQLAVVDAETLQILGAVDLPGAPDSLVFNPASGEVYVDHDDANDVWVVDPARREIVATVTIPTAPEYAVADPGGGRVYQNIKSEPLLLVLDTKTHAVTARYATSPAERPHGLALDAKRRQLFCAGANGKLAVLDADAGRVVEAVDVASGVDQIAFDPASNRVYCASGKAGISVVDVAGEHAKLLGTVKMPTGTHTVAVDPKRGTAWTAYGDDAGSTLLRIRLGTDVKGL